LVFLFVIKSLIAINLKLMKLNPNNNSKAFTHGIIISVRSSVVDVIFGNDLPPINSLLSTGTNNEILIEVLSQLDQQRVRCIALTPTQGLSRGMVVVSQGRQLTVPVGKSIMGRMFDVFGNTIDKGEALNNLEMRNIHQSPPHLTNRSTKSEVFETGIKAIDVLIPLERGGKELPPLRAALERLAEPAGDAP
jgi:F-type H+-transporting ATPase subunit beta